MTKDLPGEEVSLADALEKLIGMASDGKQPSFRDLAGAAGLDPGRDFVGASLRNLDLRNEDLGGFDFSDADLSGADFRRANIGTVSFLGAELAGAIGLVGNHFRDFDGAPEMTVVQPGEFVMGTRGGGDESERPWHNVTISRPFAVGVAPVTRGEFATFVRAMKYATGRSERSWRKPGFKQTDDHPVVLVSRRDAQAYVTWLCERSGGKLYRLLSEAEWEYCCRAGTTSLYSVGDEITRDQANFESKGTTSVDKFAPNPWGLRDMHGNVWEWCEDSWHENYEGAPVDGLPFQGGDEFLRVLRGGSWSSYPQNLRSAIRDWDPADYRNYDVGFRVARTL